MRLNVPFSRMQSELVGRLQVDRLEDVDLYPHSTTRSVLHPSILISQAARRVVSSPPPAGQLGPRVHQAIQITVTPLLATVPSSEVEAGGRREGEAHLARHYIQPARYIAETIKPQTNKTIGVIADAKMEQHKQNKKFMISPTI